MNFAGLGNFWPRALLGLIGFSSGALVAGGVVALTIGLGIVERFVGISHTAKSARLYESMICLGGVDGCLVTVYLPYLFLGRTGLLVTGLFSGVFVGGWIMALAELLNVFPVFIRRLGLTKGKSYLVISLALGKVLGSLLEFGMRWGK
ncbi:MAG: stage V sporulation protein AB [Lachnospiraceae bacterium]|nr:stage V sporulation protein AB [Lachnospiraceae bacterium]